MYQNEHQFTLTNEQMVNSPNTKNVISKQNEIEIELKIEEQLYKKKEICVNFTDINLPVPDNVMKNSFEVQESVYCYLKQMEEKERKTYCIAISHLGSSFNLLKSNGYLKWKK